MNKKKGYALIILLFAIFVMSIGFLVAVPVWKTQIQREKEEELIGKGVKFVSYSENIDFITPIGKLQFNILSAFAEFERNLISQRTKEGLRRVKASGVILGRRKGSKDKKKRKTIGYYDNKNASIK